MASVYRRPETTYIWISYRGKDGRRHRDNTGYRWDNAGQRQAAKKLAKLKTLEEMADAPARSTGWDWVVAWINGRWGVSGRTPTEYISRWLRLLKFLEESDIIAPSALRREHMMLYLQFRNKVRRSTATQEIKLLAMVIDEAIARGYASDNPCRKLGIAKEEIRHKTVWTPEQVRIALDAAEEFDRFGWLHVALLLGRYQAIRLMQCRIPLECIDLSRGMIHYPAAIVKGGAKSGKGYSQLIDSLLIPVLPELIEHRRALGKATLCSIPPVPSVLIRRFLDSLAHIDPGFESLSIHGLRATWITEAALAGVSETLAMRFTNHASREVHAIYQRITADDLRPMLDVLALARNKQAALPQPGL